MQRPGAAEGDQREAGAGRRRARPTPSRSACSIAASTTRPRPSASTPARSSAARPRRRRATRGRASAASAGMRPSDEVGVGDRRLRARRGRSRPGPGSAPALLGPDDERAAGVDAGDRAAAGADGVDVERRQPDREARRPARSGAGSGTPPQHEAHVGAGAAHVEGDGVGKPAGGGHRGRRPAPRRPGPDSSSAAGSRPPRRAGTSPPADVITSTSPARPVEPLAGTARQRGPQVGVDDRRDRPLVLPELGRHLVRARARRGPGAASAAATASLVGGVEVGVQQADGDRLGASGAWRARARRRGRLELDAVGVEPAAHLEPALARHERLGPVGATGRRATGRSWRAISITSAKPGVGDQRDGGAAPLEQGVGGDGRAVGEHVGRSSGAELVHGERDRPARVVGGRRHLDDAAVVGDEVGEGAAGVDPDPHRYGALPGSQPRSTASSMSRDATSHSTSDPVAIRPFTSRTCSVATAWASQLRPPLR